ncbi:MAG: hydrogenase maturation protease [Chromatiaceae bacterium]|nr:hydrogenase maturation protease [Chromatiaceae bacterium]MCF7995513.1 hydrogenase maturation protease [Chromatiaceae bacterium]MCF8016479.1 hydrogenase maturation protease [Chromatiaceae bacterium]
MRDPFPALDPKPLTVIGLGSPWGDDRVGWCLADALAERLSPDRARVLKLDRPGPALLAHIADLQHVVLIDAAVVTNTRIGAIQRLSIDDLATRSVATRNADTGSSHGLGLADTLALGRSLGMLPLALDIYVISIDPMLTRQTGLELTPALAVAMGPLADAISGMVIE